MAGPADGRGQPAVRRRAVTWAAGRHGITQFIDLGSGLPSGQSVHRMARAVRPDAAVAYVDNDPEVTDRKAPAILRRAGAGDGVAVVRADLADPAAVLGDPGLGKVIDLGRPVMVLAALVLCLTPAGQAREVIAGYAARVAPGSVIALSVPRSDNLEAFARVRQLLGGGLLGGELHNHARADIASFFGGLRLVPPGVVLARGWRGEMPQADVPAGQETYVLGGAAWTGGSTRS